MLCGYSLTGRKLKRVINFFYKPKKIVNKRVKQKHKVCKVQRPQGHITETPMKYIY